MRLNIQKMQREKNEFVKIKVNGKDCVKHIDYGQQNEVVSVMKQMTNKNNCQDMFKYTIIDQDKGLRMYPK